MGRSAEPELAPLLIVAAIGYLALTGGLIPTLNGIAAFIQSWTVTYTGPVIPPDGGGGGGGDYPTIVNEQILLYQSFDGGGKTYVHGPQLGDYPLFRLMGNGVTLRNVVIDDQNLGFSYAPVVISGSGNRVEGITLKNCVRYGITTLDATNFYIGDNTVESAQYCISGSGGTSSGGVVEYNTLRGMTNCGVKAKNWQNVVVRNNYVDLTPQYSGRNPEGVNFSDDPPNSNTNVVIQNNEFRRTLVGVGGYTKALTTDAGCTLSGNKFTDNLVVNLAGQTMYSAILNGDNFIVTGNTFTNCQPIQVNIGATGNIITPNNGEVPPTPSNTVVSTELINFASAPTTSIDTFLNLLDQQGMTELTLRFNAMDTFRTEQPLTSEVSAAKSIIGKAKAKGISINVDLHTWYTTWDTYLRDTASNSATNRQHYINYVKNCISAMSGYEVKAWMVLNEPQARTATATENQFILDILAAANAATTTPVSVRFMAGYSSTTGHYSSAITNAEDFLSINTYWDPRSPGTTVYGSTEAKITQAITTAHNQGKEIWVTEFGEPNTSGDTEQAAAIRAFVAYAKTADIDRIYAWVCQLSAGESYNLLTGLTPRPAFYELK